MSYAQQLAVEGGQLLLTGMDYLYGDEVYAEMNRRNTIGEQSRSQTNITVRNSSNYGGNGSGSYTFSTPSSNSGGNSRGNFGGSGISSAQQGAVHTFLNVVNAKSFDAQAFVGALRAVVNAFNKK